MKKMLTLLALLSLAAPGYILQAALNTSDQVEISIDSLAAQQFDGRDLQLGRILKQTDTYTTYYITYLSGSLKISGTMSVPNGVGPFPVVVMNHGYISPPIYTNGQGLLREQNYFAERGYVVLHPDYRNHAESDADPEADANLRIGYVEDVINSVYALKKADLPYVNVNKIAMIGFSMGGGIAQEILVSQPNLIQACALFAPASADQVNNYERWTIQGPEVAKQVAEAHGTPQDNPLFWKNISPINFFDRVQTPVIIHHGEKDVEVPHDQSVRTYETLKNLHKSVELYSYSEEGHKFSKAWPEAMQRTLDFFDRQLK